MVLVYNGMDPNGRLWEKLMKEREGFPKHEEARRKAYA
jgi:hypothetical protein